MPCHGGLKWPRTADGPPTDWQRRWSGPRIQSLRPPGLKVTKLERRSNAARSLAHLRERVGDSATLACAPPRERGNAEEKTDQRKAHAAGRNLGDVAAGVVALLLRLRRGFAVLFA